MLVSRNFSLVEFVPPEVYEKYLGNSIWFLDSKIFVMAQFIRDRFGKPITINNWHSGQSRRESGFRKPLSSTGASFSQHRYGRAIDFFIKGIEPDEIRRDIIKNFNLYQPTGLTTLEENTPTWVHVDCRNTATNNLLVVYP